MWMDSVSYYCTQPTSTLQVVRVSCISRWAMIHVPRIMYIELKIMVHLYEIRQAYNWQHCNPAPVRRTFNQAQSITIIPTLKFSNDHFRPVRSKYFMWHFDRNICLYVVVSWIKNPYSYIPPFSFLFPHRYVENSFRYGAL